MAVFDTGSNASVPAGGPVDFSNMSYQDLYNYITAKASGDNGFGGYQVAPEYQGGIAYNNPGWQQDGQSSLFQNEPSTREANDTERMFARLGQVGETLADPLGFGQARQDYGAFDPRTWGAFIPSLPGGIASAPFSAASKGYEAATGTNVESLDWDKGTISNEKLDSNQRAAVGADAAIDLVGTAMGGSGRLLSAGINAGRMAAGRGAEQIGKGFVSRMGGKAAGQMAFDIAEEGGEEFVQSYLGDIRHEQLDEGSFGRALEGAAWGAAGGALMSGGGIALNRVMYGPQATEADVDEEWENAFNTASKNLPGPDGKWERERNLTDAYGRQTQAAIEQMTEDLPNDRKVPASASTINAVRNGDYNLMQCGLGEDVLRSQWESNIDGTQDKLVDSFSNATGIDKDTMRETLNRINSIDVSSSERADEYNKLLTVAKQNGKNVRIVVGRNPDTNKTGIAYMNIKDVYTGNSISVNRWAFMMFGADVDGDKTQVYFGDTGNHVQGYLTRNFKSAVTGHSNLNEDYIAFLGDRSSRKRFSKLADDAMKGYSKKTFRSTDGRVFSLDGIKNMFNYAYSKKNDAKNDTVASVFDELRTLVYVANIEQQKDNAIAQDPSLDRKDVKVNMAEAHNEADRVVAEIAYELEDKASELAKTFDDANKELENLNKNEKQELQKVYDEISASFYKPGDTQGATHFAQFALDLAYKVYANTDLGNPFFRQGGLVYHSSKAEQRTKYLDFAKIASNQEHMVNVYSKIMAYSFKLMDVGADVENSIEGVFRVSVQDQVKAKFAGKRIIDQESFNEFIDEFIEIYNDNVDSFTKAWKSETTQGIREMFGAPHKFPIEGRTSPETMRAFSEVFGTYNIETFVSITKSNHLYGRSFNQAVEEQAARPGRWSGQFDNIPGFKKFWEGLLKSYGGKRHAIGKKIENTIIDLSKQIGSMNLNGYIDDSGNIVTVDEKGFETVFSVVNGTNYIFGPKASIRLNLGSVEAFVNTRWGRQWLSGDVEKMKNVLLSVWLTDQYQTAIDILQEHDVKNDIAWRNNLINELASKADNSALHMWIFRSFVQEDESGNLSLTNSPNGILQWLTDLDVSFSEKQAKYNEIQLDNYGKGSLISDACCTDTDTLATSAVSNRINKATRAFDKAERLSYEKSLRQIESIQSMIDSDHAKLSSVVEAIKTLCSENYVTTSIDMIAATVYSNLDIVKAMVEKGTSTNTSTSVYQAMCEKLKGGVMSWLDEMGVALGNMTIDNFVVNRRQILNVLVDPTAVVRITSPDRDGYLELTQKVLFKEYLEIDIDDSGPNDEQFWRLFTEVPQLATIVAPQSLDILNSGSEVSLSSNVSMPFDTAINKMIKGEWSDEAKRQEYELRNAAATMMMNDPDWWVAFIGSCDPKIVNNGVSMQEVRRECSKNLNRHIDFMMNYASMDDGQLFRQEMERLYKMQSRKLLDKLDDKISTLAATSERIRMQNAVDNYDLLDSANSIVDEQKDLIFDVIYKRLADAGYPGIDQLYEEYVLETGSDILDGIEAKVEFIENNIGDYYIALEALTNMMSEDNLTASLSDTPGSDAFRTNFLKRLADNMVVQINEATANGISQDRINKMQSMLTYINDSIDALKHVRISVFEEAGIEVGDDVDISSYVLTDDFYDMTAKQAVAACRRIQLEYGMSESWTKKSEKKIKKAFHDSKTNRRINGYTEAKLELRRFYNNLILSRSIKNIVQGYADRSNTEFAAQELEAQDKMISLAKQFKSTHVGNKLHNNHATLTMPDFHFENAAMSYMSSSAMMNMQSASVATGISMDGGMTKLCAAIGALPSNFMSRPSKSQSNPRINRMGRIVEELVNFFQEPMHLKMKKNTSPHAVAFISGSIDMESKFRKFKQFVPGVLDSGQAETSKDVANRLLTETRNELKKFYEKAFNEADPSGDLLGFSDEEYEDLAIFTTPYIEVVLNDGSRRVVNVSDINNDSTWSDLESVGIREFRAAVLSLNEISAKIIRGIAAEFYNPTLDRSKITEKKINEWAANAYNDWSSYNNPNISVRNVMSKIVARGDSFTSSISADLTFSAMQRWDNAYAQTMREAFKTNLKETVSINENYLRNVRTVNENVDTNRSSIVNDYMIVKATLGKNISQYSKLNLYSDDRFRGFFHDLNGRDSDIGNTTTVADSKGAAKEAIELYYGDSLMELQKAYSNAHQRNHKLAVPHSIAKQTEAGKYLSKTVIANAMSAGPETLFGETFVILDPSVDEFVSYHPHIPEAVQKQMNVGEITTAIGDEKYLKLPDGAHYKNPLFKVLVGEYGNNAMVLEKLVGGYSVVTKVNTWNEVKNLVLDGDDANVDFSYYEKRDRHNVSGRSIESYKNAVKRFIDNASSNGKMPKTISNVKQGECIGFVKQEGEDGSTVYVPVFYEGSVPKTAETVTMDISNGELKIRYSSDSIDYGGENSQKLNLFGVEYKSVGSDASSILEKWIAIQDFGLNMFGDHKGPEFIFDLLALKGRVFEMTDNIVNNNLFYTTRKIGGNLFYRYDTKTKQWVLKGNLNYNKQNSSKSFNDEILADLTNGARRQWEKVADGQIEIFDSSEVELNDTIRVLTREMLLREADPSLLFCPNWITHNTDGTFVNHGLNAYDMNVNMFLRNFSRNQVLSVFNAINEKVCPSNTKEDSRTKLFDAHGQMLATNLEKGKSVRVFALVGPHYYTGEGSAIGNPSRGSMSSYQHMVKSLLRMGVYPDSFGDLLKYLDLQTGKVDINKTTAAERLDKIDFEARYTTKPRFNRNLAAKIDASVSQPFHAEALTRYRREVSSMLEEESRPLIITLADHKKLVTEDKDAFESCKIAVEKLNEALAFSDAQNNLMLDDVAYLVKFAIGFTDNNGSGMTSITSRQFINAVDYMTKCVNEEGRIIKAEMYHGRKGDERVRMSLLPPGLSQRLWMSTRLQKSHHDENGDPSFDAFVQDQIDMMHSIVDPAIANIKDSAKRTSLHKFADALYYANNESVATGFVIGNTWVDDVMKATENFLSSINISDNARASYTAHCQINKDEIAKVHELAKRNNSIEFDPDEYGRTVLWRGDDATIGASVLRNMSSLRKSMGIASIMLRPANIIERTVTQGNMSLAMTLGQTGLGPYAFSWKPSDPNFTAKISQSDDVIEFWVAMRVAQLHGVEEEFMLSTMNTNDIRKAINDFMAKQNLMERFQDKLMDIASGGRRGISMQVQNFLDRVIQRAPKDAPWLLSEYEDGKTILERGLESNAIGFIAELFNGANNNYATYTFARQCRNWAYKGDMAQQNLASAVFSEIARQSAGIEFLTTAFISPYFQYATNRFMRVTNFIAPISSLHYMLVEAAQGDGIIGNLPIPGLKGLKMNQIPLAGVQVHQSLKEAMMIDMCHLGPGLVAMMLLGMAGAIEPPEDKDKWGNFKEWSYFGFRGDIPWWLEDCMGLVMPLVAFGKSCQLGEPRIDLITNGLTYYLGNNPAVKVADAVQILFDPFSDLYRDYDNDVEGYAKAMGGPPSFTEVVNGKATGFGLSFVAQFITPTVAREIYSIGQRHGLEKSYKKVYEQDETGRLSPSGRSDNDTMYTDYADAMVRKYTRNNPIMGLLADAVLRGDGDTGYLVGEMPNVVYYDPAQMNSIEAFSLYNDPYTKESLKTQEECDAIAIQVVSILQGHSVDELRKIGFMLDYDTRAYVSQYIWDNIATLNEQWYALEQSGGLDYSVAGEGDFTLGQQIVSKLKEDHYASIEYWKSLYNDKLWADELTNMVAYNRAATSYAQDANGEWYAVGYRRSNFLPVTLAPSETPGDGYKYVGPHEADWQTESAVTGAWTGQRGLIPINKGEIEPLDKPSLESWSADGSDTGHSKRWNGDLVSASSSIKNSGNGNSGSGSRGGYSYGRGGGGGGRRGGGGGGGGSTPNIYSRVSTPNIAGAKTMNTNRNQNADYDYLRPSFQTKGSREAYRREDI